MRRAAPAAAAATFLIARPTALTVALAGTRLDGAAKAFMGWFGPRRVATIAVSLLMLGRHIPDAERIFNIAALVVFSSIILYGLTDTAGANWILTTPAASARRPRTGAARRGQLVRSVASCP